MWAALALAAPALPSYDAILARDAGRRVDATLEAGCGVDLAQGGVVCAPGATDAVVSAVDAFESRLFPDSGLSYLAGLALRYAGDEGGAEARYRRSLELDPARVEAWYDLGELLLASGRLPEAQRAFAEVAAHNVDPATGWLGPWRLAEVAAHQRDAAAFETHLLEALRRGFTLRRIAGLPNWRGFYADPALQPTLKALLAVYGDPGIEASLRP